LVESFVISPGLPPAAKTRSTRPRSAGILLHRGEAAGLEVLLVHPGGPIWAKRDLGAWSIPKGEHGPEEDPLAAARREFAEELGLAPPGGEAVDLGEVRQKSGKLVRAWALAGDIDASTVSSNSFTMQWPPRSGTMREFPEVDRAQWFSIEQARAKLNAAQVELLDRLVERLAG
jgi:predicted NUDIX family NTP pyrophosphohydrolase